MESAADLGGRPVTTTSFGFPAALGTALLSALVLTGCGDAVTTGTLNQTPINPNDFVPGLPKGYQCPLVPNGFDPAGSIYRLDKSGTYYRVKDFSKDPAIGGKPGFKKEVQISNYVLSDKQTATAGLSFGILKNALPGLSAGGSADFNKEISVDVTVEDMIGEVIDDMVADQIVASFKSSVEPKPGNKYYLVRETVRAGSVSYRLRQADLAKLGGKAELEKLAQAKADVTIRDNNGVLEIKQKFAPERIHVCIKSAEIVIDGGGRGGQPAAEITVSLKPADETTVPTIKRVGEAQ
jgi:hypothetical protein